MNFEPDPKQDGWSWRGAVEGWPVKLEFLCDLPDQREGEVIRPPGCTNLAAANLRGTGYVARDFAWEELSGTMVDGTQVTVRARFAGLEGYLLSKCLALRPRAATKDSYDLAYVLLHNRAGGPEQAAQRLLDGGLADALGALRTTFLEVKARYAATSDSGPRGYVEQALEVDPDADPALLRADAVDVVGMPCRRPLLAPRGITLPLAFTRPARAVRRRPRAGHRRDQPARRGCDHRGPTAGARAVAAAHRGPQQRAG